jgi:hypothetical protein
LAKREPYFSFYFWLVVLAQDFFQAYRQLCVFAVNLLSSACTSTRPLPQPARQNSKKPWRPSRLRGEKPRIATSPFAPTARIFHLKIPEKISQNSSPNI